MSIIEPTTYSCYIEFPSKWPDMFPGYENPWYPTDKQPVLPNIYPYIPREPEGNKEKEDSYKKMTDKLAGMSSYWADQNRGWVSTATSYTAEFQVPGFKKEDISVEIKEGVLIAKASRADKKYADKFETLALPKDANPNEVSAKLEDGILAITVSKKAPPAPKKIVIS